MSTPNRQIDHETPGAYAGTKTALDRIRALVTRFPDASDLMVSKEDLRELLDLVGSDPAAAAPNAQEAGRITGRPDVKGLTPLETQHISAECRLGHGARYYAWVVAASRLQEVYNAQIARHPDATVSIAIYVTDPTGAVQ